MSKYLDQFGGLPMFAPEPKPKPNSESNIERLRRLARLPLEPCPHCGGGSKVYRRKLNSGMARLLIWMTVSGPDPGEWAHLPSANPNLIAKIQGDVSTLAHWEGLIEQKPNPDNPAKRDSGYWRILERGLQFSRCRIRVPSHVFVSSPGNVVLGFEETTTDIVEALGKHFNYQRLMRGEDE